jgi:hypothetical protein
MSPIHGEVSHRKRDPREMLLLSAGKLFQNVGYIQASICRIASAVNAPDGSFYNLPRRILSILFFIIGTWAYGLAKYGIGK